MAQPSDDPQPWQVQSSSLAFQNDWVGVWVDKVTLPTGRSYDYTRLSARSLGVAVLGLNPQGQILLEREYRHGVGAVIWQFPGGLAAPGEDLQAAGLRELAEETGFGPTQITPQRVTYLGFIWDNPGLSPAGSHLFAVDNLTEVDVPRRDPAEFVTLHWVSPAWLKEAVRQGDIQDRVVVAGLAFAMLAGML